jgi:hypothetical protein
MSSVDLGLIKIDYSLNFPSISFDVLLVVPHKIPVEGGKKFHLGGGSISLEKPSLDLPFSEGPVSGDIRFTLDTSRCEFTVSGSVKLKIPLVHTWRWHIGPESIRYMTPFALTEPPWSVNPEKLVLGDLQSAVSSAPDSNVKSDKGAGLHMRNDAVTQGLIRGFLTFAGAEGFIDQTIKSAQWIAEEHSAQMSKVVSGGSASGADHPGFGDVLIGLAVGATGGVVLGASGAYGFYFTSEGDYGFFGTVAVDFGILAELSAGLVTLFYWPDAGQTAKQNFSGWNGVVAIEGGEGVSLGLGIYWPEDAPMDSISGTPCGIGISISAGFGIPVNFYIGNSDTFLNVNPPRQIHIR